MQQSATSINKNLESQRRSSGKNPPTNKKIINTKRNTKIFSSKQDMILSIGIVLSFRLKKFHNIEIILKVKLRLFITETVNFYQKQYWRKPCI